MSGTEIKSDDNSYKDVQAKLTKLTKALEDKAVELEDLRRGMQSNATRTEDVAKAIENAELDPKFVEATYAVSTALSGTAAQLRYLIEDTAEGASHSQVVQRAHAHLYGRLDEVRSGRREKTPKPGFLAD
ncbi:conjugal transfer protein TraB [Streptomyces sp. NPDC012438]|uniref:conjugal transfer protein TraB n=1 Tax=Streptomyces sp. NPDC012438 TaxID=3364833 RepID=UPI0036EB6515